MKWWHDRAAQPRGQILLLHGAGAPADSDWMNEAAAGLCALGWSVMRTEFEYMARRREDGRRRPPPRADRLLPELTEILAALPATDELPLVLAGKSMGGRLLSMLATTTHWPSRRSRPVGVLALGYPFHPPGKPDRLRTEHLPALCAPLRIVQGTRDPMGDRDTVEALALPDGISVDWVADGNHDLRPRGLRKAEVWPQLRARLQAQQGWLESL